MVNDMFYEDGLQSPEDGRDAKDRERRFLASLREGDDGFRYPYDDSVAALERLLDSADDEARIVELMRRDVDRHVGGSRGRRRRREPAKSGNQRDRLAQTVSTTAARIGRPAIGAEVRVYVQTSIAQRTREVLAQRGVTLAEGFDDVARRLSGREH
jgi:hypothetical protein